MAKVTLLASAMRAASESRSAADTTRRGLHTVARLADIDRARGHAPEAHAWLTLPPRFASRLELMCRADTSAQLLVGARVLLARLVAWAGARHVALLQGQAVGDLFFEVAVVAHGLSPVKVKAGGQGAGLSLSRGYCLGLTRRAQMMPRRAKIRWAAVATSPHP